MLQLALVIGAFLAFFLLWKKFGGKKLSFGQMVKYFGLGALVVLGVWLLLTGKLAGLLAVAMGLWPWIQRGLTAHGLWRRWKAMTGGASNTGSGKVSEVKSQFLTMRLDHDSGHMDGSVLAGPYQGKLLSQLSRAELSALRSFLAHDVDSLNLLAAWVERSRPDWQDDSQANSAADDQSRTDNAQGNAPLSLDEAYAILGLSPHADADEIKAAHKRLMRANHPDRGGSDWVAARINLARDLLLAQKPKA